MSLPYEKKNIPLAKDLRRDMTKWEKHLWYDFLAGFPIRFQRQKAIGPYIADFYCHDAALVIELDGKHHYQDEATSQNDLVRQQKLKDLGLLVLRFTNSDLENNLSSVCKSIHSTVESRLNKTLPLSESF